jgi:hypothetical protein
MKAGLKVPSESSYPYNPYYSQPNGICNSEGVSVGTGNFDYYGLTDA